jgi:hypothetical protein
MIFTRIVKKVFKKISGKIQLILERKNINFLKSLRDKYAGNSCVIVGNGPSLKISDLNMLKHVVTFASNKIYLAFDETDWRPTFYTVVDIIVAKNNIEDIKKLDVKKLFSNAILQIFRDSKAYYFNEFMTRFEKEEYQFPFSKDITLGVNSGYTVVYNQLQLAYYMGFKTVYLIGVDYNFKIPRQTKEDSHYKEVLVNDNEINHFHPNYRMYGETWAKPDLDAQLNAYKMAEKIYNESGRKIYNASRLTELEIFEKISFEIMLENIIR